MQINSYAEESLNYLISNSLNQAQKYQPEVYGCENREFPLSKNNRLKMEKELINKQIIDRFNEFITDDEQTELLTTDINKLESNKMRNIKNKLYGLKKEAKDSIDYSMIEKTIINNWGNNWFFTKFGNKEDNLPNYFLFEAVTWQKEQQEATAQFISKYLVPIL